MQMASKCQLLENLLSCDILLSKRELFGLVALKTK